jgi:hypothetical protein
VKSIAICLQLSLLLTHSWYPRSCCADKDCHPVPCAEIQFEPDGSMRFGHVYFPPNMVHESRDAYCHVCTSFPNADMLNQIPQCVFIPKVTS